MANSYAGRSHDNTGLMSSTRAGLTMTAETPGLEEMIEKLQKYAKIGDTDAKRVRAGMAKLVKLAYSRVEAYAPYRTGKMKALLFSHIQKWPEGNVSGTAGIGASRLSYHGKYAGMVPFVLESGRHSNNNGRMVIKPMHFMLKARNEVAPQANAIWQQVANQIVKDLAEKGVV